MKSALKRDFSVLVAALCVAVTLTVTSSQAQTLGEVGAATGVAAAAAGAVLATQPPQIETPTALPEAVPTPDAGGVASSAPSGLSGDPASLPTQAPISTDATKTPVQVTEAMSKLNDATASLSLDDMNQAQEAIARVNLLLELEGKMQELEKLRAARGMGGMMGDIGAAMPQGVALSGEDLAAPEPPKKAPASDSHVVERITGVNGDYTAYVQTDGGEAVAVRVGDKLADGSAVKAINATSLRYRPEGERSDKTLRISSAGEVTGRAPR